MPTKKPAQPSETSGSIGLPCLVFETTGLTLPVRLACGTASGWWPPLPFLPNTDERRFDISYLFLFFRCRGEVGTLGSRSRQHRLIFQKAGLLVPIMLKALSSISCEV